MYSALAHRLLLVCLVLLVAMQLALPRGPNTFSAYDAAAHVGHVSVESPEALSDVSQDPMKLDASSSASPSDHPDDTHGALVWEWPLFRQPHILNAFISSLGYNAQVAKLLRPPRA